MNIFANYMVSHPLRWRRLPFPIREAGSRTYFSHVWVCYPEDTLGVLLRRYGKGREASVQGFVDVTYADAFCLMDSRSEAEYLSEYARLFPIINGAVYHWYVYRRAPQNWGEAVSAVLHARPVKTCYRHGLAGLWAF